MNGTAPDTNRSMNSKNHSARKSEPYSIAKNTVLVSHYFEWILTGKQELNEKHKGLVKRHGENPKKS